VSTVKGEANFEQETLTKVIEARSRATAIQATPELINDPEAFDKFQRAQGELSGALSRLLVVAEQYPNLRANQAFQDLRVALEGTENRITVARNRYVQTVAEYNVKGWLANIVRFVNDILLSAPSIVIGLFVYAVVVAYFRSFSALAGAMALALIVIPVVIRTTENMLQLVPAGLREAAYALGAPKWKVILSITLRAARAGVVTGVLLAVARIAGETAPLLFTALSNQFWTSDMSQPMASLPVTIFKFAMSPYENWQHLAWAGVFLITVAVLALNILARVLTRNKL